MNENEVKPHIDRLKKDPSINGILNFTQAILKKLPEKTNETESKNLKTAENNHINADTLNSLVTSAQSFVNPTTLSVLSKALKQSETKEETTETKSLRLQVEQLSAELCNVKEELNQVKIQLAEQSQRFKEVDTSVQYLRRRRRR